MAENEQLNPSQCREKAAEARKLAAQANDNSHRIMLTSIAETWERLADGTNWKQ